MRTLAMPKIAEPWSLTSLREKLIKIGAKVVTPGRYVTFQMAEVARCSKKFCRSSPGCGRRRHQRDREMGSKTETAEMRLDQGRTTAIVFAKKPVPAPQRDGSPVSGRATLHAVREGALKIAASSGESGFSVEGTIEC
jgi:hypothetical protein